ncbi:LytTR family DNA-binding domain-containing protein [Robiginitalea sp. SC105]|uniref:LytR/AlgR family response regulator transcription factor n=1 Tax=Robiginitalea sp. SC105 TaxID=2762332 RepID=UPI00163A494F|nr:LytTR family DNA-binding domain-containing protein [Robiginitalea sp. SC105]MBC2839654.1 LytTR family transcriptional regulator [Robiginitalea sp. SC105]
MLGRYLGKYNDVLLAVVLIPVINTINYHLTYSVIRWDWYTVATYTIDTVSGYISWWIIRTVIRRLDRTMRYENGLARRLAVQIGLTNALVLAFTIGATEGVNALYWDKPLPRSFYTYNLFIFFIWILVINGIYTGLYFYDQLREVRQLRERERNLKSSGFQVQRGARVARLPFAEIAAFYSDEGQTYLQTLEGETFALERSLNRIEPLVPDTDFFRVNRKYIINRRLILGYRKQEYGKLVLELRPGSRLPDLPGVSRLTAPAFKEWLGMAIERV